MPSIMVDVVSLNATEIARGGRSHKSSNFSMAFSLTPSTAVDNVRTSSMASVRMLWNLATLWHHPPHSHASNIVYGVRWCVTTTVDRGWWHQFERYWYLLMLDVWYRIIPRIRTMPKVINGVRMPVTNKKHFLLSKQNFLLNSFFSWPLYVHRHLTRRTDLCWCYRSHSVFLMFHLRLNRFLFFFYPT